MLHLYENECFQKYSPNKNPASRHNLADWITNLQEDTLNVEIQSEVRATSTVNSRRRGEVVWADIEPSMKREAMATWRLTKLGSWMTWTETRVSPVKNVAARERRIRMETFMWPLSLSVSRAAAMAVQVLEREPTMPSTSTHCWDRLLPSTEI